MTTPALPPGFELDSTDDAPALPAGFVIDGQEEPGMWDKFKSAVKGNAEFKDAPNFESLQWQEPMFGLNKENLKVELAGMFGGNEDKLREFQEQFPDREIKMDANGNPYYLGVYDEGRRTGPVYLENPRLDSGDIGDFAGEAGSYMIGGVATAPIKQLLPRMFATGAAAGATNMVNQKIAGRDEIDKGEAALAGAFGGAFEALTPIVSKVARSWKGRKIADKDAGFQVAKKLGIDLSDDQAARLGQMAKNIDADPEVLAQHAMLNQTPTRGTLTKSQDILDTEQMLRQSGNTKLKQIAAQNDENLAKSFDDFKANMSGGKAKSVDAIDAGGKASQIVQDLASQRKTAVSQAYDDIGEAMVSTDGIKGIPQRLQKALTDNNVVMAPGNTDKAFAALDDVAKNVAKLDNVTAVNWRSIDSQRKRINSLFNGAKAEDKRALTILRNEFDNAIDDAFEKGLASGDPETLRKLSNARGLAADYFKDFTKKNGSDAGGKLIEQMVEGSVPDENIVSAIFTVNGMPTKAAPQMAKKYIETVGKGSEGHQLFKEMTLQKLVTGKGGDMKTRTQLRTSLKNALAGKPTFMNQVFNKKELGFISKAVQFLDDTSLKGMNAKSSGTVERLTRWANKSVADNRLGSGMFNLFKDALDLVVGGSRRAASLPVKQVTNYGSGVAAAQAQSFPNQNP